jgi:hypothetical protein
MPISYETFARELDHLHTNGQPFFNNLEENRIQISKPRCNNSFKTVENSSLKYALPPIPTCSPSQYEMVQ